MDENELINELIKKIHCSANDERRIKDIVRSWAQKYVIETNTKIAQLEAKVLTYESIIKNSNFAPMVIEREA
jgi:hypothetical protein